MKRALLITLSFFYSYSLVGACLVTAEPQLDIQGLDKRVFIGQAYPSGKVYLERFNSEASTEWSKDVVILPLDDTKSVLGKTHMKASFVDVAKDDETRYIPGVEGMDDSHKLCGLGEIKKIEDYKYLSESSEDYFDSIYDHCEPNEGIGIYRADLSKYSFLVLGIDPRIALAQLKLLSGKRPLTPADRQEIVKQKKTNRETAAEGECTTVPGYIDSATQIAEIGLAQGDLRLRVSTYVNPGCLGHLSSIYVLDVLQHSMVLRKFEVQRYRGAL